ncbi:glycerophosphodiester phosphodiesterase family protein [Flavobacterium sp. HXWNR69]|uniref:Glycerophosphodiester phosphodiesterase family protein n=1 Tax=Flavobacterium fragile TaxID=2949085 RepID=A0ABT0TDX1_9FLAO|nr:glycerophosphodiester phosphodiesterase family protein [Flavobacterium sp. HXWNR69]MCL9769180.1 glycerophosphodiester phosphodiesterase family protein [Flavobacterium sp. HXWNR69]
MKKNGFLLVALFHVFLIFSQDTWHIIDFKKNSDFKSFFRAKENFYPLVSAHRGGPTTNFPENCIATFTNTIQYNPAIIETDIAMTKDSVLVMMHDNTIDRTTTGTGNISNYTYQELQKFSLKDNQGNVTPYKIETLDEVLTWGKGKVVYTLDVKRGVPFKLVIDAVRKNKAENYSIIITYNANQAAEVASLAPDVLLSVSARGKEDVERLESMGVKVENMVAFIGTSFPKSETMDYMKKRGITCISGTMGNIDKSALVNGDKVYFDIVNSGVMIISSDRPIEVAKQMDIYIKKKNLKSSFIKKVKK